MGDAGPYRATVRRLSHGRLRLEVAWCSDRGCVRTDNEDRILVEPTRPRFAVVDGMGGEAAGEVAAELTCAALAEGEDLVEAVIAANLQVRAEARRDPGKAGMGCVLTAVDISDEGLRLAHVGDTRAYVARGAGTSLLTRDHTVAAEQAEILGLDEEEAQALPTAGQVTRDVGGMSPHRRPDWVDDLHHPFVPNDLLLLCSDGLTDVVSSSELMDRLRRAREQNEPASALCAELVELALRRGGPDNVSVLVVRRWPPRRLRWREVRRSTALLMLATAVAIVGAASIGAAAWRRFAFVDSNIEYSSMANTHVPLAGSLSSGTVDLAEPLHLPDGRLDTLVGFETEVEIHGIAMSTEVAGTWRVEIEEGATLRLDDCAVLAPDINLTVHLVGTGSRLELGPDCELRVGWATLDGMGTVVDEACGLHAEVGGVLVGHDVRVHDSCFPLRDGG